MHGVSQLIGTFSDYLARIAIGQGRSNLCHRRPNDLRLLQRSAAAFAVRLPSPGYYACRDHRKRWPAAVFGFYFHLCQPTTRAASSEKNKPKRRTAGYPGFQNSHVIKYRPVPSNDPFISLHSLCNVFNNVGLLRSYLILLCIHQCVGW